jgi:hypothetical protein
MKVNEIHTSVTKVLTERFGHDDRSEGLHASQIWEDISKSVLEKPRSPLAADKLAEFGTIGFIWERVLERTLAAIMVDNDIDHGRYMRPGEQCVDGIYLTPDYCDLNFNGNWVHGVEEWKVRWCSYRKADDLEKNFWKVMVQEKAYCYALQTPYSRLRMLFLVGDWRGDITPKLREFELEFTSRELQENWSMLTNHARRKGWL